MCSALKQLNKDKTAFQRIFVQDVRKCEDMSHDDHRHLGIADGMSIARV